MLPDAAEAEVKRLTAIIEKARELHHRDGEIEIDEPSTNLDDLNATVSEGADPGCYVRAWVWVPAEAYEPDETE